MLCFAFKSVNHSILFARKVSYAKKPIISVILSIDRPYVNTNAPPRLQCCRRSALNDITGVEMGNINKYPAVIHRNYTN